MAVDTRHVNAAAIVEAWPMSHMEAETNNERLPRQPLVRQFGLSVRLLATSPGPRILGKVWLGHANARGLSIRVLTALANTVSYFQGNVDPCFTELRNNLKECLDQPPHALQKNPVGQLKRFNTVILKLTFKFKFRFIFSVS